MPQPQDSWTPLPEARPAPRRRPPASAGLIAALVVALAAGCNPAVPSPNLAGAGGAGLRKAGLTLAAGTVAGPASDFVSDQGGGVLANAGGFSGVLRVPLAGLIANHGAGVIANNGAKLISEQGGGLISDNGAGLIQRARYALQGVGQLSVPLGGVKVHAFDERGTELTMGGVYTGADGSYTIPRLGASGGLIFLTAELDREGQPVSLVALAPAPRSPGLIKVEIDPATTIVAKKVREMLRRNAFHPTAVRPVAAQLLANAIAARLDARGVVAAALLAEGPAALVFDRIVALSPAIRQAAQDAVAKTGSADLAAVTPSETLPAPSPPPAAQVSGARPAANPAEPQAPANALPAPAPGSDPAEAGSAPTPEPFPEASQEPAGVATPTPEPPLATPTPGAPPTATSAPTGQPGPTPAPTATPGPLVTSIAGEVAKNGFADGPGATARFAKMGGLALDGTGTYLYVADGGNNRVRRITLSGDFTVKTLAGSGTGGKVDGTGAAAQLANPIGLLFRNGLLLVAEAGNHLVREVTPAGTTSTYVGSGVSGYAEGTGPTVRFNGPTGLAFDGAGNLLVADRDLNNIRRLTPALVSSTLAGSGRSRFADGIGAAAEFAEPIGLARSGLDVFLTDRGNHAIRKITPEGVVTTIAGNGVGGFADGTGGAARFRQPHGIVREASGNLLVADTNNARIRRVTPAGVVTTVIGSGSAGFRDATSYLEIDLKAPTGLALDAAGNLYVGDEGNAVIRRFRAGF